MCKGVCVCVRVCVRVCVCVCLHDYILTKCFNRCYIWIGNVITDSNTCSLSVSGVFLLFGCRNSMCKGVCVCVCVCVCVRACICVCVGLHDYFVTKCFHSC